MFTERGGLVLAQTTGVPACVEGNTVMAGQQEMVSLDSMMEVRPEMAYGNTPVCPFQRPPLFGIGWC